MNRLRWRIDHDFSEPNTTTYNLDTKDLQLIYRWDTEGRFLSLYTKPDFEHMGAAVQYYGDGISLIPNSSVIRHLLGLKPIIEISTNLPVGKKEDVMEFLTLIEKLGH